MEKDSESSVFKVMNRLSTNWNSQSQLISSRPRQAPRPATMPYVRIEACVPDVSMIYGSGLPTVATSAADTMQNSANPAFERSRTHLMQPMSQPAPNSYTSVFPSPEKNMFSEKEKSPDDMKMKKQNNIQIEKNKASDVEMLMSVNDKNSISDSPHDILSLPEMYRLAFSQDSSLKISSTVDFITEKKKEINSLAAPAEALLLPSRPDIYHKIEDTNRESSVMKELKKPANCREDSLGTCRSNIETNISFCATSDTQDIQNTSSHGFENTNIVSVLEKLLHQQNEHKIILSALSKKCEKVCEQNKLILDMLNKKPVVVVEKEVQTHQPLLINKNVQTELWNAQGEYTRDNNSHQELRKVKGGDTEQSPEMPPSAEKLFVSNNVSKAVENVETENMPRLPVTSMELNSKRFVKGIGKSGLQENFKERSLSQTDLSFSLQDINLITQECPLPSPQSSVAIDIQEYPNSSDEDISVNSVIENSVDAVENQTTGHVDTRFYKDVMEIAERILNHEPNKAKKSPKITAAVAANNTECVIPRELMKQSRICAETYDTGGIENITAGETDYSPALWNISVTYHCNLPRTRVHT